MSDWSAMARRTRPKNFGEDAWSHSAARNFRLAGLVIIVVTLRASVHDWLEHDGKATPPPRSHAGYAGRTFLARWIDRRAKNFSLARIWLPLLRRVIVIRLGISTKNGAPRPNWRDSSLITASPIHTGETRTAGAPGLASRPRTAAATACRRLVPQATICQRISIR